MFLDCWQQVCTFSTFTTSLLCYYCWIPNSYFAQYPFALSDSVRWFALLITYFGLPSAFFHGGKTGAYLTKAHGRPCVHVRSLALGCDRVSSHECTSKCHDQVSIIFRKRGAQADSDFTVSLLLADSVCHKNGHFIANLGIANTSQSFPPHVVSVSGVINPPTHPHTPALTTQNLLDYRLPTSLRCISGVALATFPMRQDIVICSSAFPLRPVEPRFPDSRGELPASRVKHSTSPRDAMQCAHAVSALATP